MPVTRAYLSNIVRIWPLDEQERMHAAGTPGWPKDVTIYRDEVKPRVRKAHSPEGLTERAQLLRKTSRRSGQETIYVASLAALAWSVEDFMGCLAAASDRGATVVVLSSKRRIPPNAGARAYAEAQSEFLAERRRAQTSMGRKAAALVTGAKRKAETKVRADLIAADWPLRTVPTADLLLRAGRQTKRGVVPMAYATAVELLGCRPARQEAHDRAVAREERKADAKRKR